MTPRGKESQRSSSGAERRRKCVGVFSTRSDRRYYPFSLKSKFIDHVPIASEFIERVRVKGQNKDHSVSIPLRNRRRRRSKYYEKVGRGVVQASCPLGEVDLRRWCGPRNHAHFGEDLWIRGVKLQLVVLNHPGRKAVELGVGDPGPNAHPRSNECIKLLHGHSKEQGIDEVTLYPTENGRIA